jgi:hypothetical protein
MAEKFRKISLKLKEGHQWKAKPGHLICVIDRGAIRFDYPEGWDLTVDDGQINIRDRPKPDDNCVLSISRMYLPVELADQVPLRELVQGAMQDQEESKILERKQAVDMPREDGIELAYTENRYIEAKEQREACSRLAVARGSGVYCLITFSFWADDRAKCEPVWNEALRSLTLGVYAKDPTIGPTVH